MPSPSACSTKGCAAIQARGREGGRSAGAATRSRRARSSPRARPASRWRCRRDVSTRPCAASRPSRRAAPRSAARDNAWRRGSTDAAGAARRSPSEDGRSRRAMGRERRRSRMQKRRANGQANALPWAILALTRQRVRTEQTSGEEALKSLLDQPGTNTRWRDPLENALTPGEVPRSFTPESVAICIWGCSAAIASREARRSSQATAFLAISSSASAVSACFCTLPVALAGMRAMIRICCGRL